MSFRQRLVGRGNVIFRSEISFLTSPRHINAAPNFSNVTPCRDYQVWGYTAARGGLTLQRRRHRYRDHLWISTPTSERRKICRYFRADRDFYVHLLPTFPANTTDVLAVMYHKQTSGWRRGYRQISLASCLFAVTQHSETKNNRPNSANYWFPKSLVSHTAEAHYYRSYL